MPDADLTPAPRRSTVEYIADELRAAVVAGTLPPGAQLGEADLAHRFEVSRGPLREAMQRLVSEGILEAITNRGVFVVELTAEDMADVYRARAAIERGAVETLLETGRQRAHRALGPPVRRMKAAARDGDGPGVSDADLAFHETLVECSGSPRLIRAMRTLIVETRLCLSELRTTYPDLRTQVREHEDLRRAIRDAPADEVLDHVRHHLDDAVQRLTTKRAG